MADVNVREDLSEKERKRLERIDKLDANNRRKKVIFAVVTACLILFFVGGTVLGGMYILSFEGTQELPAEPIEYAELPENEQAFYDDFLRLVQDTKHFAGTKADVSVGVSIPEDSIVTDGENAEVVKAYLGHIRSSAENLLSSHYESQRRNGTYGEDFSDLLHFTEFDLQDANVEPIINEENANDIRYVFTFDGCSFDEKESAAAYGVFALSVADGVVASMKDTFASVATVGDATLVYDGFVMTAEIDRLAGQLNNVNQTRICKVTLPLTFIGEWEDFGEMTLSFDVHISKNTRFTRVSFAFRDEVYYIEKGSSDELKTNIVSDESPADIQVEWISSDPQVLSVDGNFFKGEKVSADPVTVTGSYTYNGVTYTDTCIFYVRVPVEGVKVSEKEIALTVGERKTQSATLSPADATLQKVYWFTSDESIAAVDENGVITACGIGEAEVYCITLDGNYRSACTVTVTQ